MTWCLRARRRCAVRIRRRRERELLDASLIEHKQWYRTAHLAVLDQRQPAIVENDPISVETSGSDGVILADREIAYNDKPYILCGDTSLHERNIFGDGVILAVTETCGEGFQRTAPPVDHTPLGEIAHGSDRQIDRAVDDPDASATGLRLALGNDRQEVSRRRWAQLCASPASRKNVIVSLDIGLRRRSISIKSLRSPPVPCRNRTAQPGSVR